MTKISTQNHEPVNLPEFDLASGTDLYGKPLESFNELIADVSKYSDPDQSHDGVLYAHYSRSANGFYIGAATDANRPFDFKATRRSKKYYEYDDWVLAAFVEGLPSNSALYEVTNWSLEQTLYDRMGNRHFRILNGGRPFGKSSSNAEPWNHSRCKQLHQRMQWYLAPIFWRIYNEVPIRHGQHHKISGYTNQNHLKRIVTMANSGSVSARQLSSVTNWFLAAMGIKGQVSTRDGNAGLAGSFNRNQVDDLFKMHRQENWQKLLNGKAPTDEQIEELYQEFVNSVEANDGEIIYPTEPLVELKRQNAPDSVLMTLIRQG
ncbi:hypothetical protein [Vibrio campbellii]|uniref:hypothetical protein n=1 Tax=Vibrio campbellii TaxID=680 RepID=UPI003857BDA4